MTRHDPYGARDELKRRIVARLAPILDSPMVADDCAAAVMELFYDVRDDWDRIDVTTLGQSGESFIENRFLVARVPVQGVAWSRPVDRTVGEPS
jgi:hypothetical protein